MFITKKRYNADIGMMRTINAALANQRDAETKRANKLAAENSQLRADVTAAEMAYEESRKSHARVAAELATLRAAAEKHQRSRANLKQFRKVVG